MGLASAKPLNSPEGGSAVREPVEPRIRKFAQSMRKQPTEAERRLWAILRGRKLGGLRFRRQHPIAGFIADFICLERKLVVEVDGSQHAMSASDAERDARLASLGFRVLRFWNEEIVREPDAVAARILHAAAARQ